MKSLWQRILPKISPGIRLKLTFFTLFFVSALLMLSFLLSYVTQKNELSKSLDNEVKVPLNASLSVACTCARARKRV